MKKKVYVLKTQYIVLLAVLGFLLLLGGGVTLLATNIKKDQEATVKRIADIKEVYKKYSDSVDKYNEVRNNIYTKVYTKIYYDTMKDNEKSMKAELKKYEDVVDEVASIIDELDGLCGDINFTDTTTSVKCESYASVYEQMVNSFLDDLIIYNDSIDKYNEYQEGVKDAVKLEHYMTEKQYLDYNKDGKYEGKEEKEETGVTDIGKEKEKEEEDKHE